MPTCADCRNWKRLDGDKGECHACSPSPLTVLSSSPASFMAEVVVWPAMSAGDWCGAWQPLPVPQAPDLAAEVERLRNQVDALTERNAWLEGLLAKQGEGGQS